jgi:hypothetical protein
MRTTLYHIKLASTVGHPVRFCVCRCFSQSLRSSLQCGACDRIALKSKIRSNICLEEFPLQFGRGRAMVLVVIFGVGKINRSSNKEGSGYRGKPPMKFRHLEYFVAAAEELNFTHAAGRLDVSQPPFSKQIHDLEGELGIEFFERQRKGVALTPAGKSFLIDARRILEDCEASIRKAQRISRGEIGELAIGYMSAMTHDFLGKALEVWRLNSPGITVDCIEMDSVSQERALLEGASG